MWASSFLTCPPPIMTQRPLPSQTPLQESLIELSDSSLNKMATDMFLGVGVELCPGPWARGDPAVCDPAHHHSSGPHMLPLPQLRLGPFKRRKAPSCPDHSLSGRGLMLGSPEVGGHLGVWWPEWCSPQL